jgi:type IV secretory pathway TrbD component
MSNRPELHIVHKSINRLLTVWGAERGMFFLALIVGGVTFNFFGSLASGVLMFGALFAAARLATTIDPRLLRILLNSARFRSRYDPAQFQEFCAVRRHAND